VDDIKIWVDDKKSKINIESLINVLNKLNWKLYVYKMLRGVLNDK